MENIWDFRKNQHCFSNASRSHPVRHCWVFLCCIASFSSVSDAPNKERHPDCKVTERRHLKMQFCNDAIDERAIRLP